MTPEEELQEAREVAEKDMKFDEELSNKMNNSSDYEDDSFTEQAI